MIALGIILGQPDTEITVIVGDPVLTVWELPTRHLVPHAAAEARARYGPDVDIDLVRHAP